MDAGAVLALAAAQPLAVNRHMAGAAGRHRAAQRPFQIGRRNRPENIMVSGMTGRPAAADPAMPSTAPMDVSTMAVRSTSTQMDVRVAPSARLMPISRSRWLTEYQIDP